LCIATFLCIAQSAWLECAVALTNAGSRATRNAAIAGRRAGEVAINFLLTAKFEQAEEMT
jgi:hypothetical protein